MTRKRFTIAAAAVAALVAGTQTASAFTPLGGPEFQVPTYGTNYQSYPSIVGYSDGSFLVVWKSSPTSSGAIDVIARRFDAAAIPVGTEFVLADETQMFGPAEVAARPDGGFVASWPESTSHAVKVRLFDADDVPLTPEFQVNGPTMGGGSAVAVRDDGRFLVAWSTGPGTTDVVARVYDGGGNALGTEFPVNVYTTEFQTFARVAATTAGDFVIVWADREQDQSRFGVFGRMFDGDGNALTGEFPINQYTPEHQIPSSIAATNAGGVIVTWDSADQDGDGGGVFARMFDSQALPLGSEFQVNSYTTYHQGAPHVSVRDDDTFLVVWHSNGLFGQLFDAAAQPFGEEFQFDANGGALPRAFLPNSADRFQLVWFRGATSYDVDGNSDGVFRSTGCIGAGTDSDADGIGDSCDSCDTPPGQSFAAGTLARFRFIDDFVANDRYLLKGTFPLPVPSFADIDPLSSPVRLRVEAGRHRPMIDVEFPAVSFAGNGTAGWSVNGAGTKWIFRSRTSNPAGGVAQLVLSKRSDGSVGIKVTGKGRYGIAQDETLMRATVTVGDARAGECAETSFVAADCGFDGMGRAFACRR